MERSIIGYLISMTDSIILARSCFPVSYGVLLTFRILQDCQSCWCRLRHDGCCWICGQVVAHSNQILNCLIHREGACALLINYYVDLSREWKRGEDEKSWRLVIKSDDGGLEMMEGRWLI